MLQSTVLTLSILTNRHQIHTFVRRLNALDTLAGPHVSKKIQLFPQCDIQRAETLPDGSFKWTLQAIFVLFDSLNALFRNKVSSFSLLSGVDHVVLELHWNAQCGKDLLYASGNLRADAVAREENDFLFLCSFSEDRAGGQLS